MLVVGEGKLSYTKVIKDARQAVQEPPTVANYGRQLGWYRKRHKLSKAAMARLLMISQPTYDQWENHGQIPGRLARAQIEKILKSKPPKSCVTKNKDGRPRKYFHSIEPACDIVDNFQNSQAIDNVDK